MSISRYYAFIALTVLKIIMVHKNTKAAKSPFQVERNWISLSILKLHSTFYELLHSENKILSTNPIPPTYSNCFWNPTPPSNPTPPPNPLLDLLQTRFHSGIVLPTLHSWPTAIPSTCPLSFEMDIREGSWSCLQLYILVYKQGVGKH